MSSNRRSDSDTDVVVIGAGVVGLAVAATCAQAGHSVVILERNDAVARETTSRNSEVIHAGIYYPPGSLKATLCARGSRELYARCRQHRVPHRRTGKLVVATRHEEQSVLEGIQANAHANGVALEDLDASAIAALEPDVRAVAALFSPGTGVVDAHAYAMSFLAEAEAFGASLVLRADVVAVESMRGGFRVEVQAADTAERQRVRCAAVVNAAGLGAAAIAERAGFDVDACGYRVHYCKGDYFSLAPSAPVSLSHLIYPVPTESGLGIHATADLGGRIRFGPDTEYVDTPRYAVDPSKAEVFAEAVRRYLPVVDAELLAPDFAGIRTKLAAPGEGFADFVVAEESDRGMPGFVNCIGIESPGLTAASAIASRVSSLLF